jgi:drug/metabolite transporter superfamily protein YnfA
LPYWAALVILLCAALLEAGGDAIIRAGIHSATPDRRLLLFLFGSLVLAFYGYTVNAPPWNFGRLLGAYVAILFVVAQAVAWVAFGQRPTFAVLAGGALIVAGGCLVSLGK